MEHAANFRRGVDNKVPVIPVGRKRTKKKNLRPKLP